jgi:hypothetical protein
LPPNIRKQNQALERFKDGARTRSAAGGFHSRI